LAEDPAVTAVISGLNTEDKPWAVSTVVARRSVSYVW